MKGKRHSLLFSHGSKPCENKKETLLASSVNDIMRFSRAQILGALVLLAIIWLVILVRLFLFRS
ncbi:MAG: hypothetical protein DMF68_13090 [Acidobacteria bacterium]|nr:MAG: hypothetical protein DMF68_13090 [Acidobacteriota bacterium]